MPETNPCSGPGPGPRIGPDAASRSSRGSTNVDDSGPSSSGPSVRSTFRPFRRRGMEASPPSHAPRRPNSGLELQPDSPRPSDPAMGSGGRAPGPVREGPQQRVQNSGSRSAVDGAGGQASARQPRSTFQSPSRHQFAGEERSHRLRGGQPRAQSPATPPRQASGSPARGDSAAEGSHQGQQVRPATSPEAELPHPGVFFMPYRNIREISPDAPHPQFRFRHQLLSSVTSQSQMIKQIGKQSDERSIEAIFYHGINDMIFRKLLKDAAMRNLGNRDLYWFSWFKMAEGYCWSLDPLFYCPPNLRLKAQKALDNECKKANDDSQQRRGYSDIIVINNFMGRLAALITLQYKSSLTETEVRDAMNYQPLS